MSVSPAGFKPSFNNTVWRTRTVQTAIQKAGQFGWIFDGRNLCWSRNDVSELRFTVNMDQERGRQPRADKGPDIVMFIIRKTTVIRLDALRAYLEGNMSWDDHILECMNFFDHIIRKLPSENMISIKRNFYDKNAPKRQLLDETYRHIEAIKGIYASIRTNSSIRFGGTGLSINVDVANTAFWYCNRNFLDLTVSYLRSRRRDWNNIKPNDMVQALQPIEYFDQQDQRRKEIGQSDMFKELRRISKLTFFVKHRGKMNDANKVYRSKGFVWDPKRFGRELPCARNYTFERQGKKVSIEEYFLERYQLRLRAWNMPLIRTDKDGVFPMEAITPHPFQKYNFKLDGDQTAKMIKFAVTRPRERGSDIMANVKTLRWVDDPCLKEYGLRIKDQMEVVKARVIPNPAIQFAKSKKDPGVSGRWDLRDQVFTMPNPRPLKAWAVVVVNNCVPPAAVMNFTSTFVKQYRAHGGNVQTAQPPLKTMTLSHTAGPGIDMEKIYNEVGKQFQMSPDLIFYILPNKDGPTYERMKKSMDVRFATLSQMVQSAHVMKSQPQYCSNVAMKVNAKLGGYTSKLSNSPNFFPVPTMIIGVDISHGSFGQTGQMQASLAAMTMSMDKDCVTYAAKCQTNGVRVEVLSRNTIQDVLKPMVLRWCQKHRISPVNVFYLRDGVSEGEFQKVMDQEIDEVRKCINEVGRTQCKLTVIVGTKRHHIRFFPDKPADGDKNSNPLPGTVVETEVTHPFHYDFYLCSHVAIQGTARPVHYHVLQDEIQMPVDHLQTMIYHHSYQYVRSTTPVSIHPAIYYAHLAAARGRAQEDIESSARDPRLREQEMRMPLAKHNDAASVASSRLTHEDARPLVPIGGRDGPEKVARPENINFFTQTMWYI